MRARMHFVFSYMEVNLYNYMIMKEVNPPYTWKWSYNYSDTIFYYYVTRTIIVYQNESNESYYMWWDYILLYSAVFIIKNVKEWCYLYTKEVSNH